MQLCGVIIALCILNCNLVNEVYPAGAGLGGVYRFFPWLFSPVFYMALSGCFFLILLLVFGVLYSSDCG